MSNVVVNPFIVKAKIETWISTAGTLSALVYHPAGKGDKTDGWATTGLSPARPELDVWNGTTWSDSGNDINVSLNGASGCGTSTSIIVAGGDHQSPNASACSSFAGGSWTQKANMTSGKSRTSALGTSASYLSCGGQITGGGGGRTGEVQEYDLSGDSWSSGVTMPSDASADGVMGCAGDGTSISNGMCVGGWSTDYSIVASSYAFNGTNWTSVSVPDISWANSAGLGGGNYNGFWVMGGDLSAGYNSGIGAVGYYDGSSWSTKDNCLLAQGGSGGANNGGTNPLIGGGNEVGESGNGNWNTGQYWG